MSLDEDLDRARRLPEKDRRPALLRIAAAADAANQVDTAFSARKEFVRASHNSTDGLAVIAAYGWCLARHDEDPTRFPLSLWQYKWVLEDVPALPEVARSQIEELLDDLERRVQSLGGSEAVAPRMRLTALTMLGELEQLSEGLATWRAMPKTGRLNDCRACDVATEASTLVTLGRHGEALYVAEPLLAERMGCASQPHYTLATLLESARAEERVETSAWQRRGLELIDGDRDYLASFGDHIRHLAIVGSVDAAVDLTDRTAAWVTNEVVAGDRLGWYRGARLAAAAQVAAGEADLVSDAAARADEQAVELAAQFDARNGNTYMSSLLTADMAELRERAT